LGFAAPQCAASASLHRNRQASGCIKFLWRTLAECLSAAQAFAMGELVTRVRQARQDDAAAVARIYVDSWHDTYVGIVPTRLLRALTHNGQAARWRSAIRAQGREFVLVAESETHGLIGMSSLGPARDGDLGYDGEVYALYVDPAFFGQGAGRALLHGGFSVLRGRGYSSCLIWAHAKNPVRFFYEAMGGKLVAERTQRMLGDPVPEIAFGWPKLALAEKTAAR
jgi:GNAT superfamily N-acetyltransferase